MNSQSTIASETNDLNATVLPWWTWAAPLAACLVLGVKFSGVLPVPMVLAALALMDAVLAAVHHAEVVAHKVGEPYGTLVLALAVTLIEVALIVSLMVSGGADSATLARDTVFAAVMIILTGMVGACLLVGASRHHEQSYGLDGVSATLAALAAISVLTMVLPNFTESVPGPYYNAKQLTFVAFVCLVLYGTFVLAQTVRHRDYFLPADADEHQHAHAAPPTLMVTTLSSLLLLLSLVAVVWRAKTLAPSIETAVADMGAPKSLVGVIIAAVVLLPEGLAALRAARANRLQTSLNLALGSAMASIGLTVPAVAVVSIVSDMNLAMGLDGKSTVLLVLTLIASSLALRTGRTTVLHGVVLLVIFGVYLMTTIWP